MPDEEVDMCIRSHSDQLAIQLAVKKQEEVLNGQAASSAARAGMPSVTRAN